MTRSPRNLATSSAAILPWPASDSTLMVSTSRSRSDSSRRPWRPDPAYSTSVRRSPGRFIPCRRRAGALDVVQQPPTASRQTEAPASRQRPQQSDDYQQRAVLLVERDPRSTQGGLIPVAHHLVHAPAVNTAGQGRALLTLIRSIQNRASLCVRFEHRQSAPRTRAYRPAAPWRGRRKRRGSDTPAGSPSLPTAAARAPS